ncbi:unnamed protein product, partial [Effrenium voratum]
ASKAPRLGSARPNLQVGPALFLGKATSNSRGSMAPGRLQDFCPSRRPQGGRIAALVSARLADRGNVRLVGFHSLRGIGHQENLLGHAAFATLPQESPHLTASPKSSACGWLLFPGAGGSHFYASVKFTAYKSSKPEQPGNGDPRDGDGAKAVQAVLSSRPASARASAAPKTCAFGVDTA